MEEEKGTTYKIPINNNTDPLLLQVIENKDIFSEKLGEKLSQKKDPRISKITDYFLITALELYVRHCDPSHPVLDNERCSICLCEFFEDIRKLAINEIADDLVMQKDDEIIRLEKCDGHYFHRECIVNYIASQSASSIKCPNCMKIYGIMTGDQPQGIMQAYIDNDTQCSGYKGCGTIVIEYQFPDGELPNGKRYHGTARTGYLPNNEQGREVLRLLRTSFERRLTFTIGTSVTTGRSDCVIWNGVHHKTNVSGGSTNFGYPDPTYFERVKLELASRGVY